MRIVCCYKNGILASFNSFNYPLSKIDNYIFVDDLDVRDKKEDKYSRINENYLIALRCFDSYEDISLFLDSIRDKFDIKIVIENLYKRRG